MSLTTLRPYQAAAIDAVLDYWGNGGGNPLVSMATGTGKSVVIASLVRELHQINPDIRLLMLVHVKELVAQNVQALLRSYPTANIGINSAGLGRRDKRQPILFASVQSVHRMGPNDIGQRDVVLIDEAHLVPRDGDGMYLKLMDRLRTASPDMRVAGFTATPYRLDSGRLDQGEGRLFDDMVVNYGIGEGIRDGYLSPLVSKATATSIDVAGVARRGGEFVTGALELAVDKDFITRGAVDEMVALGEARRSWLAFCAGVAHAEHVRDEIRRRGITCEMVSGDTPGGERDRIIRAFKDGQIRCLTNAMVLTTGFDAPKVDLVAMLRPTLSTGLYVQIVGRGTRLADGKSDCLVLDFAGNVRRHGPVDAISVETNGGGGKAKAEPDEVRAKECPGCASLVALNTRTCPTCGHQWPVEEKPKHAPVADGTARILSTEPPAWVQVDDIRYFRHAKEGKAPSMRVEYGCGMEVYREWICFEHADGSFPRQKAERWWKERAEGEVPVTVAEALKRADDILPPGEIRVRAQGKFFEIVGRRGIYDGPPPVAEEPASEPQRRSWQKSDLDDTEIPF
ncbi:DEAD/DEAH box helicase [Xanthobacter autotrophicus]|uniref:DEAD/DEAH box helicase n=1 Tax=Xanthobacter autotrophicus TaxID=280 RepID=UPI0037263BFD